MTLEVFWHPDVLRHDTGAGVFEGPPSPLIARPDPHPEGPVRIENMQSILERGPLAERIRWRDGVHATDEQLLLVHDAAYVEDVRRRAATGGRVTGTTVLSRTSWDALTAAAGTAIAATDAALAGARTYALVRPPGHHAQPAQADGYCFINNAAIAAEHARRAGIERVAIVDWDVHHGNGNQECFYDRPDVLTVSLHMDHGAWGQTHPQTGAPEETGAGDGVGFNVNVALPFGTGDTGYGAAFEDVVAPVVDAFRPGLVIVSAGQDAAQFDPNGRMCVSMGGFHSLGRSAARLADAHGAPLVLIQEGGYAPSYAAFCLHATLAGALGVASDLADPLAYLPDDVTRAREAIAATRRALGL